MKPAAPVTATLIGASFVCNHVPRIGSPDTYHDTVASVPVAASARSPSWSRPKQKFGLTPVGTGALDEVAARSPCISRLELPSVEHPGAPTATRRPQQRYLPICERARA